MATSLTESVDRIAADTGFSGVVRVDRGPTVDVLAAYGLAHRAHGIAITPDTRFGTASAAKGLTACTVMALIAEDVLALDTTARSLLGDDLPLIDDGVTVEQLLAHRSGIGDYVDEEAGDLADQALSVAVETLSSTQAYLDALDGHPAKFAPDERFAYCNSGYVVLALLAERATGQPFPTLVEQRVCAPAGMRATAFLRSDELPGDAAAGYLDAEGLRTNVFALPVVGSGDGGIYTTAADVHRFWRALFAGRIVARACVDEMVRPRSDVPQEGKRYGMGFWLAASGPVVMLEGYDPGVSFGSMYDPTTDVAATVIGNTAAGAWPIAHHLESVVLGG